MEWSQKEKCVHLGRQPSNLHRNAENKGLILTTLPRTTIPLLLLRSSFVLSTSLKERSQKPFQPLAVVNFFIQAVLLKLPCQRLWYVSPDLLVVWIVLFSHKSQKSPFCGVIVAFLYCTLTKVRRLNVAKLQLRVKFVRKTSLVQKLRWNSATLIQHKSTVTRNQQLLRVPPVPSQVFPTSCSRSTVYPHLETCYDCNPNRN